MAEEHKNPTMKDVADAAGVSITTVSHVLNNTRFVSLDSRQRVEAVIDKLKFKVNPVARNLRSGKSRLIGFVASNLESHFYVNIAKGIEKTIEKFGYQLIIIDAGEKKENESRSIESLYLRGVDGLIVVPVLLDCTYLSKFLPRSYPVVFVDREPSGYDADVVLLENNEAAYMAVKRFIKTGCKKIAFVSYHFGGQDNSTDITMKERLAGYERALDEAGFSVEPELIKIVPGTSVEYHKLLRAETYNFTQKLLNSKVDAVLCGNSLAAIGVVNCLEEHNVKIGSDVKLITFDDDIWLSLTNPRISAVAQPSRDIGALAAKQLLKRIKSRGSERAILRLGAKLILRESC